MGWLILQLSAKGGSMEPMEPPLDPPLGSYCGRIYCGFYFLQGCKLQEEAVTCRKWRHVTSGERKWPGNDVIWPDVTWKWL